MVASFETHASLRVMFISSGRAEQVDGMCAPARARARWSRARAHLNFHSSTVRRWSVRIRWTGYGEIRYFPKNHTLILIQKQSTRGTISAAT